MNKSKFKKYFKKIQSFEEWIVSGEELSGIENDLLLDYIKKLYEAVKETGDSEKSHKEKKNKKSTKITNEVLEENPVSKPVEKEEVIEQDVEVVEEIKHEEPVEEVKHVQEEERIPEYSQDFLDLFKENTSNELSEKLGRRPISDLKKAFGINEKIFTVKELFGGNKDLFDSVISKFNSFGSFEEAKEYILKGLAKDNDWDSKAKIKKAEQFIKIIRRRYIK